MIDTTTRNADLGDLVTLLKDQHARKLDVVTGAGAMRFRDGVLHLQGTGVQLDPDGVTTTDGRYLPTAVFDDGIAGKLNVPAGWLRKLRTERTDLYDNLLNGLLHGKSKVTLHGDKPQVIYPPEPRKFMVRAFQGDPGGVGVARALLSNQYKRMDNIDVLMAALAGIKQGGVTAEVTSADLSESRMYVRVAAPEVRALAPALLKGYRSPFADPNVFRVGSGHWTPQAARQAAQREGQGYAEGTEPVLFAGLVVSNSEVGNGRWTITPSVISEICMNGLQMIVEAMGKVHVGGKLEEGIVEWSDETQRRQLDLITAQTADAVRTFLSPGWLARKVDELEKQAGKPVEDAPATIENLGKALGYNAAEQASILGMFVRGGQLTAGGVMQAVTATAQTLVDPTRANELEASALKALAFAAS